jgi:predicted MarR family transcription regulator
MAAGHVAGESFGDFRRRLTVRAVERSPKTPEQIEAEMERLIAGYEGRHNAARAVDSSAE